MSQATESELARAEEGVFTWERWAAERGQGGSSGDTIQWVKLVGVVMSCLGPWYAWERTA